ncbi:unnamed protein product, partial [Owenia fusiformis]
DREIERTAMRMMKMDPKNGTATWLALEEARVSLLTTEGGRSECIKAVVILVTDEVSNPHSMSKETIKQAELLKKSSSYEPGIGAPTVILVELPKEKEKVGLAGLVERTLTEREFAAIPSKPEYRFKPGTFDDLEKSVIPLPRCQDL